MPDSELVVVGDLKTPTDWTYSGVRFISVAEQRSSSFDLAHLMPYNHYCRKMLGYLDAIERGAEKIVDTDDDNIPKANWKFPDFIDRYDIIDGVQGFINIYQFYTNKRIWPRGFPLQLIQRDYKSLASLRYEPANIGIWQGLADEDPDVDAIYRLTDDSPTYFQAREPLVLARHVLSPFNSQNTMFRKECFPLLYLPTFVTFRFTDILRSLVAQPILWAAGYQLGFIDATVIQKRNPHNYMRDFESEIPMYLHAEGVTETISKVISSGKSIADNLFNAYEALLQAGIVTAEEMQTLGAWLSDLQRVS